jgi:hypothetical protein
MATDFIPSPDPDFDALLVTVTASVNQAANPLQLSATQKTAFTSATAAWPAAWQAWQQMAPEVQAALQAKDKARAQAEAAVREVNNLAQANTSVTDTARAAADLPVHKQTRTPVGQIETMPILLRVDNLHLLHRLWFVDSASPNSRAKPAGAASCEIRQQIVPAGGTAPTDPDTMPFLALDTKAPYRADLEPADAGKTAYYAQRWTNTRGEPGPWSTITSQPII